MVDDESYHANAMLNQVVAKWAIHLTTTRITCSCEMGRSHFKMGRVAKWIDTVTAVYAI